MRTLNAGASTTQPATRNQHQHHATEYSCGYVPRATDGGNKDDAAYHRAATLALWSSHCRAKHVGRFRRFRVTNIRCFLWHVGAEGRWGAKGRARAAPCPRASAACARGAAARRWPATPATWKTGRARRHVSSLVFFPIPAIGSIARGTQWLSCSMHGSMGRTLNTSAIACRVLRNQLPELGKD